MADTEAYLPPPPSYLSRMEYKRELRNKATRLFRESGVQGMYLRGLARLDKKPSLEDGETAQNFGRGRL